MKYKKC